MVEVGREEVEWSRVEWRGVVYIERYNVSRPFPLAFP